MELVPFFLQGVILAVDEFYCHQRREMRKWERWGHPLDTLTFAACIVVLVALPPNDFNLRIYSALAVFSCLFITKDEWEHRSLSTSFENWLHSLLFMLHPVVLISAGYLWWNAQQLEFLRVVLAGALVFALYQLIFWNFWRKAHDQ